MPTQCLAILKRYLCNSQAQWRNHARRKRVLVFYPHNPFNPSHGSHLRCLQQLQDLSRDYDIILASSSKTSDSEWPAGNLQLAKVALKNTIRRIDIFEFGILGALDQYCSFIFRAFKRLIPLFPCEKIGERLHRAFFFAWFNWLSIRYQPCATVIHYTYWAYLSSSLAGGVTILELHDLLPVNHYLTRKIGNWLQASSSSEGGIVVSPINYVDRLSQLPADVVLEIQEVINQINRLDLVWMISHREKRLLEELGMTVKFEVIYPLMTSKALCQTRNNQAILPVGPNAFNTYSLQNFIKDVIPLLDSQALGAREIQVTGRFWGDQPPPMPLPLKYYGVVDDYAERLSRSAFMIAPTSVGTGQQIKIFEALASGIPVITYRCAVPADVLSANPSIIGVDTPAELAEAIVQLWCDKQVLQHYWVMAAEAAERQAKRRSTFPYCCSLKKALAAYNDHKEGSAGGRFA